MKPLRDFKINHQHFDAYLLENDMEWNIGLMFSRKKILVFDFKKKINALIHMFFVFYPIYAIALDKKKKVIDAKLLYPFISFFNFRGNYLVEIPKSFLDSKLRYLLNKKYYSKIKIKW